MKKESQDSIQTETAVISEHLVWQARDGDLRAFRSLYDSTVGYVYAICVRMVAEQQWAEELTQEVFVKAWKALPQFNGKSTFKTWIHRISVNTVISAFREKKRHSKIVHTEQNELDYIANTKDTNAGMKIDLEAAIASLPEKARQIIVLFDIEGYSHEEIATLFDITIGTSKSQLHRARKLVQEMMK